MHVFVREQSEDRELVRLAREGSLEALGELYARYGEGLFRTAYRMTGSKADAEDVLQDVFVGLRDALRSFDPARPLAPWLSRVAVRTTLTHLRSQSRRQRRHAMAQPVWPAIGRGDATPLDCIMLERALEKMPLSLRTVLILREVEGYSHGEIGDLLGISPAASATRLTRALKFIRSEMRRSEP
jgi:RNA polymerase sigma-70 factor, ECF subfamily